MDFPSIQNTDTNPPESPKIKNTAVAGYKKIKLRLQNFLQGTKYCGICLDVSKLMSSLDEAVMVTNWERSFLTTMGGVLDTLFGAAEVKHILTSGFLCNSCRNNAVNAYRFIINTRRTSHIVVNYLTQLNCKISDVHKLMDKTEDNDFANTLIVLNDPTSNQDDDEEKDEYYTDIKTEEVTDDNDSKIEKKTEGKYICGYCNKTFVAKQGLAYHISKLHNKAGMLSRKPRKRKNKLQNVKKYIRKDECPDCETDVCEHKKYLASYKKQRLAGCKRICCPDCEYVCYLKMTLIAHANKVHLKTFRFMCEICSKPLHSKLAYKVHKKKFHTKYFKCEYCEREYMFQDNLEKHTEVCKTVVKNYTCEICPAGFHTKERLANHVKKHFKKYPCPLCTKVLSSEACYKIHMEMHISNSRLIDNYQYICPICNKNFTSFTDRELHVKTHAEDMKPMCVSCDLHFETAAEFMRHLKTRVHSQTRATQNTNRPHKLTCKHCNYTALDQHILEAHTNRYHLKIAPYKCTECSKKFTSTTKLAIHLKTHSAVKRHKCELCEKLFCGPTALKKHMRLHTGERPHLCDICGESFISASVKNLHVLKKHTGKSVQCPLCDMMFYTLYLMRSHVKRTHWKNKGEKFDYTKMSGLKEEHYDLFRDRRLLNLD